ncbi:MAG: hypothetical protein MI923_08780 [Phycisphaerales bacterium]|nr:hypothetical protein [Phycisphaerales bacterium]
MRKPKAIPGFFLRLLLIYGVLAAPWPALDRVYLSCFRAVGNRLFGSFGSEGTVEFVKEYPVNAARISPPEEKWPVKFILRKKNVRHGFMGHYLARHGYMALTLVMALILATPIPWSRRWKSLFWGLILANGFIVFRVFVALLNEFTQGPIALFSPTPFGKKVLQLTFDILTRSPEFTFVVPFFIWILVTLRKEDFERWLNPAMIKAPPRGNDGRKNSKRRKGRS